MSTRVRKLIIAGLIGAVAAGGINVSLRHYRDSKKLDSLIALWSALGGVRPFECRIAGGLPYARYEPPPLATIRRGPQHAPSGDRSESIELLRATANVYEEDALTPSRETARRVATANLLRGDPGAAIGELSGALRGEPDNAGLLSDLAAANVERARLEDRPIFLIEALEHIERAIELNPDLVEAHFNRAVVLERLFLISAARKAWTDYLALDPESGWVEEAHGRIAALDTASTVDDWTEAKNHLLDATAVGDEASIREIVQRFPHPSRVYARNELLPKWAEATRDRQAGDAKLALQTARIIGNELATLQRDYYLQDTTASIKHATGRQTVELIDAQLLEKAARANDGEKRHAEAARLHERAATHFAIGGDDAGRLVAQRNEADSDFLAMNEPRALRLVTRVRDDADARGYIQVAAVAWWLSGTIAGREGRFTEAQTAYEAALRRLVACKFTEGEIFVHASLADLWSLLGQNEEACRHFVRALESLRDVADTNRRATILHGFADRLAAQNFLLAALVVQNESLRLATEQGDAFDIACAFQERGVIYSRLTRPLEAASDLRQARGYLGMIQDEGLRNRVEGDLLLAEVESGVVDNLESATASCDRAQQIYDAAGDRTRYLQSLMLNARTRVRAGDVASAEVRLHDAVGEILRVRSSLAAVDQRASFLETQQAVFDEAIAFQATHRSDAELSFAISEAGRARSLLDFVRADDTKAARRAGATLLADRALAAECRRRLVPGVLVIEYAWLADGLYAWTVDRGGVELRRLDTRADLGLAIEGYRDTLAQGHWSPEAEELSRYLYDALIRPLEPALAGKSLLVVVPDKDLWGVPFSALCDRADDRFLIEDLPVTVAPSTEVYLASTELDERLERASTNRLLVFGNPAVDDERFSHLPRLESAEEESRAIASLDPRAKFETGPEATKRAFLREIEQASVAHFAGHAVPAGRGFPEPGLLFAGRASSEGVDDVFLGTTEICRLRLSQTRLVVLAACQTGVGPRAGREGDLSVARALLVAGVPCVMATLWDVEDRATAPVIAEFHRRRFEGENSGQAFRSAVLAAIHSPSPEMSSPAAWSAFYVLGGYSNK